MRKRTKAREIVLKMLYAWNINGGSLRESYEEYWASNKAEELKITTYVGSLIAGISDNIEALDAMISKCAKNWKIERMAVIDRNVLRMASFELMFLPDVPPKVAINEAIDIVKKYGNDKSGKFVNGILDKVNKMTKDGNDEK